MGNIKQKFFDLEHMRLKIEHRLGVMEDEAEAAPALKGVTLRIPPGAVVAIDNMAAHHDMSRQELLSEIVMEGIHDVIEGTFSPYDNREDLVETFYAQVRKQLSENQK